MKKIILLSSVAVGLTLLAIMNCAAQSKFKVGAGLGYGTQIDQLGIRVGGIYNIDEQWAGAADLFFFFPEKTGGVKSTFWALNLNGHYNFDVESPVQPYALAGLNIATAGVKINDATVGINSKASTTKLGLNLGVGGIYNIDVGGIFAEAKYVISDYDQFVISVGVRFDI
jgi:opacity protein-like surface antigen